MKHTPRPWKIARCADERTIYIGTDKHGFHATIFNGYGITDKDISNAHLIASAPDYHKHSYNLAILVLQSDLYGKDAEIKLETDNILAIWKNAEGEE